MSIDMSPQKGAGKETRSRFVAWICAYWFLFTPAASGGPTPQINPEGVVNGESDATGVAPGSTVFIHGSSLATETTTAVGSSLPSSLSGTQVRIDGVLAPLYRVSPDQIAAQVPWEANTGVTLSVQVIVNGVLSNTVTVASTAYVAGLFPVVGSGQGAIVTMDGVLAAPSGAFPGSRPVRPGETISIFATGLGPVNNRPATGSTASSQPLATTRTNAFVTVGGVPATNTFVGLAPAPAGASQIPVFPGVYRLEVQVAANTPGGDAVPVTVGAYGVYQSNTVTIAVAGPTPAAAGPSAVTSFDPVVGPAGTTVTLNGKGFSLAGGVKFGGVPAASFTRISDTLITAVVPPQATSGSVSVTASGQTVTGAVPFTVTTVVVPTVRFFTPTGGWSTSTSDQPLAAVTITGNGFTGATAVTVNGRLMNFSVMSNTTISATVQDGSSNGLIAVTTPGGTAFSRSNFTVTTYTGGGDPGGVINSIAIDPRNSRTIYVGTELGVFKSTNGGARWTPVNAGLVEPVGPVAIDPSNPEQIYAGTNVVIPDGDPNVAVFKSMDGGADWSIASNGIAPFGYLRALAIDPASPSTVYAGRPNAGLYRSTDGGISWVSANNGLTDSAHLHALAIAQSSPPALYAGTRLGGIFKSTDGGGSWTPSNRGLTNLGVYVLAVAPSDPSTIYAGTLEGVFKSNDAGSSWTRLLSSGEVRALALDPSNASTFYVATVSGVFKTADDGATWAKVRADAAALAIDPAHPSTIYAGTDGDGMFKSTDGGRSWAAVNDGLSLPIARVDTVAIDPSHPSTIYAGLDQGGGAFKSIDGGTTWKAANNGLPQSRYLRTFAIDPADPSTVYAGTGSGLFRTKDGGSSWAALNSGIQALVSLTPAVAIDPTNSDTIYAGGASGVFKSTDGGLSWRVELPNVATIALVIDPSHPSTIYAVATTAMKSTDGGSTWTTLNVQNACGGTQCGGSLKAVAIDPSNPSTIYLGRLRAGIFKSTDGGATLTATNNGLPVPTPGLAVLVIDPSNPSTLYAGTDAGVYKSMDSGSSWKAANAGLPLQIPGVDALAIDPTKPATLYAGTREGNVYKSLNGGASWRPTGGLGSSQNSQRQRDVPRSNELIIAASGSPAPTSSRTPTPQAAQPSLRSPVEVFTAADGTRFAVEELATKLEIPGSLAFAPDGRLFFTERTGRVRVMQNETVLPEPALLVTDIAAVGEAGLLGMALHPDFAENHLVYLVYSARLPDGDVVNRLVRYREVNSSLGDRVVLLDNIRAASIRDGARLRFGPDRKLYLTMGDAAVASDAQDLASYNGKILRLNDDGTTPRDNPFSTPVFSLGHRNPQGIDWHPVTGDMWETEHGNVGNDEVNVIEARRNYGWPTIEGDQSLPGMERPVLLFSSSIAPAGASFYTGSTFPTFQNDFFFAALAGMHIHRVRLDPSTPRRVLAGERLLQGRFGRIRDIVTR